MYCSYCGAKLNDDAKFCSACGKSVVNAAQDAQTTNVVVEEEKPQKKPWERKPKQPQPPKEQKPEGESVLDKKLLGKLPVRTLLGALVAIVVVILAVVLIVNAVDEKKRTTILGEIPHPEEFFGLSADIQRREKQVHYNFEYKEVSLEMAEAYVQLLTSNQYPFVQTSVEDDTKTGTAEKEKFARTWKFSYNGEGELWFESDWEVYVRYYYSNYYGEKIEVWYRSPGNFRLVPVSAYSAEAAGQEDVGQENAAPDAPVTESAGQDSSAQENAAVPQAPAQPVPEKVREPELVASEIAVETEIDAPDNAVPELSAWSNGAAEADRLVDNESPYMEYDTSYEVMKEYLQALQANGFTLVDTYENSYKGETYLSWGFTCDAMPGAKTIDLQYDDTPCHVTIWMADDYDEYTIEISPSLQYYDTGLRRGGSTVNEVISGPSAGAGLLRLADGSYQTTDGRLTTAVGTAMVIRDGKTYTCDARREIDEGDERLWVEDYYRTEGFLFEVPEGALMEGDVLLASDLMRERYHTTDKEDFDSFNWHTPLFVIASNGKWKGPQLNDSTFEAVTVRVMYYQPGGEAVYYIYAKMPYAQPAEVEALVAVDLSAAGSGNFSDASRIRVGDSVTVNYSHHEYGANYEVYEWEITDGAGNVSIEPDIDSCRVIAEEKGVATVKVTYQYGTEEPDVLTGIMRRVGKSKSQTYNFIIE